MQKYFFRLCLLLVTHRDLAQPGRALALGARCRWFESNSPDHIKNPVRNGGVLCYGEKGNVRHRLHQGDLNQRRLVRLQAKGGREL